MVCEPFLLFNAILHVYALTFSPILSLKVVRTEILTPTYTVGHYIVVASPLMAKEELFQNLAIL